MPADLIGENPYSDHVTRVSCRISGTGSVRSSTVEGSARPAILMYHSVSDVAHARFRQFALSPAVFAEQMAYLHQHGYTPITVTQYVKALAQGSYALPERPVVLTFDDGFADFFTNALPVLRQYDFAATLYVATGFINGTSRWLLHEKETTRPMLSWEQLTEISHSRVECGAHSHSHPQLDTLPDMLARQEIVQSKEILEDHLECEVSSFAYPFGYHSLRVRCLVRDAGYTSACAVGYTLSPQPDDVFSLARVIVSANMDMKMFAQLLVSSDRSLLRMVNRTYDLTRGYIWQCSRRCMASVVRHLQGG